MTEDEDDSGDRDLPDQVGAEQARALVAGGDVRVIDVRSEEEYAEERLANAVRADPDDLADALEDDGSGRDAILVVCADGSRSAEIAEQLRADGTEATSIDGGFGAWTSDGLPAAPGRDGGILGG